MIYIYAIVLFVISGSVGSFGEVIDCQRPPALIDPALCCKDGGRDEITENCAKRMNFSGEQSHVPPTVDTATCLAECILLESGYLNASQEINLEMIKSDLKLKFANDSMYAETMYESFQKCVPITQQKFQNLKQMPFGRLFFQRRCSPFSGMLLGCTYMEYFKNCPTNRWTVSSECTLAKQFVTQCALGA